MVYEFSGGGGKDGSRIIWGKAEDEFTWVVVVFCGLGEGECAFDANRAPIDGEIREKRSIVLGVRGLCVRGLCFVGDLETGQAFLFEKFSEVVIVLSEESGPSSEIENV